MIKVEFLIIIIIIVIFIYFSIIECFENFNNDDDDDLEYLKDFTKEISIYRPVESKNLRKVKNIIIDELKDTKMEIKEQSFTRIINNKNYSFSNIIAKNNNVMNNTKYILLGVHVDSPQIENCESAIDAATGISILLLIAKRILEINKNFPLMLLFIDGEEAIDGGWSNHNSLSGSRYFVDNYNLDIIDKVYIIDLIGGSFNNTIAAFKNNPKTHQDLENLSLINKKFDKQVFINPKDYISDANIEDDYLPFFEKNKYSVNLIPYSFPDNHHTLNDSYKNINWKYVDIFYKVFLEFLLLF